MRMAESLTKAVGDDDNDDCSEDVKGLEELIKDCLVLHITTKLMSVANGVPRRPAVGQGFAIHFTSLAHRNGRCTTLGREATHRADRQSGEVSREPREYQERLNVRFSQRRLLCNKDVCLSSSERDGTVAPRAVLFITSDLTLVGISARPGNESCLLGPIGAP